MLVPRCVYAGLEEGVTSNVIHGFGGRFREGLLCWYLLGS